MLNNLFKKTPTVEEFREYTIKYLLVHKIHMPNDSVLIGDKTNGFGYAQIYKSQEQQQLYIAWCEDVRTKNPEIHFDEQAIQFG